MVRVEVKYRRISFICGGSFLFFETFRGKILYVFRACEKKRREATQKQKSGRFVPDIGKSMKNDAGENRTYVLQRTSRIYDLDCKHLGMFALFFSIGNSDTFLHKPHINCLQCV